jgi:small subunit ribosomal protein S21
LTDFQVGDVVRVRTARRRNVTFTVREITGDLITAQNDRGGEARYDASAFELVGPVRRSGDERPPRAASLDQLDREIANSATTRPTPGESPDSFLKRFKKAVQRAGIIADAKRHEHFIPKPQRRRMKSAKARARRGES